MLSKRRQDVAAVQEWTAAEHIGGGAAHRHDGITRQVKISEILKKVNSKVSSLLDFLD